MVVLIVAAVAVLAVLLYVVGVAFFDDAGPAWQVTLPNKPIRSGDPIQTPEQAEVQIQSAIANIAGAKKPTDDSSLTGGSIDPDAGDVEAIRGTFSWRDVLSLAASTCPADARLVQDQADAFASKAQEGKSGLGGVSHGSRIARLTNSMANLINGDCITEAQRRTYMEGVAGRSLYQPALWSKTVFITLTSDSVKWWLDQMLKEARKAS